MFFSLLNKTKLKKKQTFPTLSSILNPAQEKVCEYIKETETWVLGFACIFLSSCKINKICITYITVTMIKKKEKDED